MSVARERLQEIFDDADEADGRWNGSKTSLLASWVRDLAQMVAALDAGQERLEGDLGALSDGVDETHGVEPDPLDLFESDGIDDLTTVPYVVDNDQELNGACIKGGGSACSQ
jgi:hypothetical protein